MSDVKLDFFIIYIYSSCIILPGVLNGSWDLLWWSLVPQSFGFLLPLTLGFFFNLKCQIRISYTS